MKKPFGELVNKIKGEKNAQVASAIPGVPTTVEQMSKNNENALKSCLSDPLKPAPTNVMDIANNLKDGACCYKATKNGVTCSKCGKAWIRSDVVKDITLIGCYIATIASGKPLQLETNEKGWIKQKLIDGKEYIQARPFQKWFGRMIGKQFGKGKANPLSYTLRDPMGWHFLTDSLTEHEQANKRIADHFNGKASISFKAGQLVGGMSFTYNWTVGLERSKKGINLS